MHGSQMGSVCSHLQQKQPWLLFTNIYNMICPSTTIIVSPPVSPAFAFTFLYVVNLQFRLWAGHPVHILGVFEGILTPLSMANSSVSLSTRGIGQFALSTTQRGGRNFAF